MPIPQWQALDNLGGATTGFGTYNQGDGKSDGNSFGPFYAGGWVYFIEYLPTGDRNTLVRVLKSQDMEVFTEVLPATHPSYSNLSSASSMTDSFACGEYLNGGTHVVYVAVRNVEPGTYSVVDAHGFTLFYSSIDLWKFDLNSETWTLLFSGDGDLTQPRIGRAAAPASSRWNSGNAFPWALLWVGSTSNMLLRVNPSNGDVYLFHADLGASGLCVADSSKYFIMTLGYSIFSVGTWSLNEGVWSVPLGGCGRIVAAYVDSSATPYIVLSTTSPNGSCNGGYVNTPISPLSTFALYGGGTVIAVLDTYTFNSPGCTTNISNPFTDPDLVVRDAVSSATGNGPYNFMVSEGSGTFLTSFRAFGGSLYIGMIGQSKTLTIIRITGLTAEITDTGQEVAIFQGPYFNGTGVPSLFGQHLELYVYGGTLNVMWKAKTLPSAVSWTKVDSTNPSCTTGSYTYNSGRTFNGNYNYATVSASGVLGPINVYSVFSMAAEGSLGSDEYGLLPTIVQKSGVTTLAGQTTVVAHAIISTIGYQIGQLVTPINIPVIGVTCPPLTTATVGHPYSSDIGVTGGAFPFEYTFSIDSGSLPPGLSLDPSTGTISGTPTVGGVFTFTVKVVDQFGFAVTSECSITVTASPVPPPPATCILVIPPSFSPTLQPYNEPDELNGT